MACACKLGMNGFTPEQQFFTSCRQWRGDETRIGAPRVMIQSNAYPISKYRVNGPLSNMPQFQQAFRCKPDTPMVRQGDKSAICGDGPSQKKW